MPRRHSRKLEEHVHLELRELIMSESKVQLIEPQRLSIDFPDIGAAVAIRAEGNEVFILVGSTRSPRDDVVNFHIDISTSGDGAAVAGLDKDATAEFSGYWRAPIST